MARKTRSLRSVVGACPALRNLLHFLPVAHHTQRVGFRQVTKARRSPRHAKRINEPRPPPHSSRSECRDEDQEPAGGRRPGRQDGDRGRLRGGVRAVHAAPARAHVGAAGGGVHADPAGGAAAPDLEELAAEAHGGAGDADGFLGMPGLVHPRRDHHRGELR